MRRETEQLISDRQDAFDQQMKENDENLDELKGRADDLYDGIVDINELVGGMGSNECYVFSQRRPRPV